MNENTKPLVNGGYPLHTFKDVEEIYERYISSPEDRALIKKAYDFIIEKHKTQFRKSGEPYYHHLLEVAYILADLHAGPKTIIAGLLHDLGKTYNKEDDNLLCTHGSDVLKNITSYIKKEDYLVLKGRLEFDKELAIRIESYEVLAREK